MTAPGPDPRANISCGFVGLVNLASYDVILRDYYGAASNCVRLDFVEGQWREAWNAEKSAAWSAQLRAKVAESAERERMRVVADWDEDWGRP